MTTSNWIELTIIIIVFTALILLRVWARRKLDSIDGLGEIKRTRDASGKNRIDL